LAAGALALARIHYAALDAVREEVSKLSAMQWRS
jgi:hypothetical protein